MRNAVRLLGMEVRLFLREPMTVIFVVVLPLVMLYVLNGVFGNQASPELYEGLGASTFYAPTYVALSVATIGILFLPVHLAVYRESGVLKRFRASALTLPTVFAGHLMMSLTIALASGTLLSVVALAAYDVQRPAALGLLVGGTVFVALAFACLGLLLGLLVPSARAAQGLGVLLFFLFLVLGGPGPPPEVLPSAMVTLGDWLPLTYAGRLLRGLWVDSSWAVGPTVVLIGVMALSLVGSAVAARTRES